VPAAILGLTAIAVVIEPGLAGRANAGPHGFSDILYAIRSATATNGSAFAGLNANTAFYRLHRRAHAARLILSRTSRFGDLTA
jgi:potassium-transporting ATPase potassium-binding subunit